MFDSGASVNTMILKVMNKLGLEITSPYLNVCGFESRGIEVCGLIEGLEVRIDDYTIFPIIMDIVVIDVPET